MHCQAKSHPGCIKRLHKHPYLPRHPGKKIVEQVGSPSPDTAWDEQE